MGHKAKQLRKIYFIHTLSQKCHIIKSICQKDVNKITNLILGFQKL